MPIHEIRVVNTDHDPIGDDVAAEAQRTLQTAGLDQVRTAKVYRLEGISDEEARRLAEELLVDPVNQRYTIDEGYDFHTDNVVEVAYKPGVMNPESTSIVKAAQDMGINPQAASSSREYAFLGGIDTQQTREIVGRLLVNDTVEEVVEVSPVTLIVQGEVGPVREVPIRSASEKELMDLSDGKLFLNLEEMNVVQKYFRKLDRDPTDAELEIIAGRWSEHCGHKTFNARVMVEQEDGAIVEKDPLISRIKSAARRQESYERLVVSAFEDNSGAMRFYDGMAICGKVETHNSPSAIEPYGGAMTGSGGVFRDIMGTGQGAKTIISTDMFCFAPPDLDMSLLPEGTLQPDYIHRRVVQGVRDYGNRMGIPTANGSVHYHEDFRAKPTVIVGAYGILPEDRAEKGEPLQGDQVVIIGGRTGRDGIHGATFSSGEMTGETANINSSAVQIGNAIEEKRMFDALLEARDRGLIRALTDCGAAGFSSAIGEMGEDIGVTVDISKAPLKYPGLAPWEIWLSESQERMVAAVSPDNMKEFMEICRKYNVEAVSLGEFDGSNTLTVNYGDQNVAELDYDFLKNGLPQRVMPARWEKPVIEEIKPEVPKNEHEWVSRFKAVLSHGNVASKEPIVRQYDHGVQGGNVVSPFGGADQEGPNDALVVKPVLNKPYGVVQAHGMNPILNRIDPYEGSKWAVAEAMANYVATGGDPDEAVLINNYIWPFPDEKEMGSLDRSVDAVVDMMDALGVPVISGKDSLSSTYRGKDGEVIKIPPVLAMSVFGRIPDVEKTVTTDLKEAGNVLAVVGKGSTSMGGSVYFDVTDGSSGELPIIDPEYLKTTLNTMQSAIASGSVLSCHDVSEGGIAVAVAEMCFGGNLGADLTYNHSTIDEDAEAFLFAETAGTFVVEVSSDANLPALFGESGFRVIGRTTEQKDLRVQSNSFFAEANKLLFKAAVDELKQAWQKPMRELFH